ncbi:MAG: UDP-N-acetylmuramate dehydrogenase [Leptospira sp.]|nr:UDP-N-acetylmuramate dehydrogenase [Leptospira sp.]
MSCRNTNKDNLLLDRFQEAANELQHKLIPYQKNVTLAPFTSFKIGGVNPLFLQPENEEQIHESINILSKFGIDYKILGGGTNLLVSDHPDDFAIIRLSGKFREFQQIGDSSFFVGTAALTTPTFRKISLMGFTGSEFLSTIPGYVGGAVIQNAGCYGGELFNLIDYVEFIRDGGEIRRQRKDISFGYRMTEFLQKKDSIITGIALTLQPGDNLKIQNSLNEKREKRNASQPENKRSAGSVFKNPSLSDHSGHPLKSWKLIEDAGLRGFSKGGAIISPEHCNFIVNFRNATATDVDYLICLIQEKVFHFSGIKLTREVEYFGRIP